MESLGGLLFPLFLLLLFVPIFLSGRKQRRQMLEMQRLQSSLEVGDVVTTTSGLRGRVVDTDYEDTVDLEIADGVVTTWLRRAVATKELESPDAATAATAEAPDAPATRPDADLDGATPSGARADTPAADTPSDANGSSRS